MNIKLILVIIVVFLLYSCSTIKDYRLKYLKKKYERENNICEDILNGSIKLDSVLKDKSVSDSTLTRRYYLRISNFNWLEDYLVNDSFMLIDIEEYEVYSYSNGIPPKIYNLMDITFTIEREKNIDVLSFVFFKNNNKYKLQGIKENPSKFYKYRRPKVNEPDWHFY